MQVNDFYMGRLTNAFHASFHHAVCSQINEIGEDSIGLTAGFLQKYKRAVSIEQDIVNRTMGSPKTELLRAQDELRDQYFRAVRNTLRNAKFSSKSDIKGLYDVIYKKLLKPYPASIMHESDHTESSRLRGFIYDVKQYLTESQRTALGITADMTAMETANEAFETLYLERVDEYVQNPAGYGLQCRADVDVYWAQLVRTLNYYSNETANPNDAVKTIASMAASYTDSLNKHITEFLKSVSAVAANNSNTSSGTDNGGNGTDNGGSSDNSGGNSGTSGGSNANTDNVKPGGTSGGNSQTTDGDKGNSSDATDSANSGYGNDL